MKFLTFLYDDAVQLGILIDETRIFSVTQAWLADSGRSPVVSAPSALADLLAMGDAGISAVFELRKQPDSEKYEIAFDTVKVLPPIPAPRKNIFCVGRNYREHIIEGNLARGRDPNDFPKAVEFFTKPPTAVVGHLDPVNRHADVTKFLDYEIELGIVIGKTGINIARENALEHVFGYTIVNDITARDLQLLHGQWFKGKGLDTTCPIGPYVVHRSAIPDPHNLEIELDVNGEVRQKANTSSMLFRIEQIIAELSAGMTLEAGDIIATGTPSGVGLAMTPPCSLKAGDVVRARISGIGELKNAIVE